MCRELDIKEASILFVWLNLPAYMFPFTSRLMFVKLEYSEIMLSIFPVYHLLWLSEWIPHI